jgi:hypothetical protein
MLAVELDRTVQFPRLPLAKTVIRIGTENEHNRKYEVEGRANLSRRCGVSEFEGGVYSGGSRVFGDCPLTLNQTRRPRRRIERFHFLGRDAGGTSPFAR